MSDILNAPKVKDSLLKLVSKTHWFGLVVSSGTAVEYRMKTEQLNHALLG